MGGPGEELGRDRHLAAPPAQEQVDIARDLERRGGRQLRGHDDVDREVAQQAGHVHGGAGDQ